MRDVIAREAEHVRLEAVSERYGAFDMCEAGERAVMGVGEMNDAETVELFRQAFQPDSELFQRKAVRFIDRMACDLGKIPGQNAKRLFRAGDVVETFGESGSSCGGGFQLDSIIRSKNVRTNRFIAL